MKKMVVCLMGPTASGKTKLAIKLAKKFPFELVSVDSALVYKKLDIGAAKPNVFHHLINIKNPDEIYSVGEFCKDAVKIIQEIHSRNKIPLLVGGTMMYFRALQQGLSELPQADITIRQKIRSITQPYEKLIQIDPVTAKKLHPNDTQRIERALEVYEITGIALSEFHKSQQNYLQDYKIINLALIPKDREKLKSRIEKRFLSMLKQGFVGEVKKLLPYKNYPALKSVGYAQACEYLAKNISRESFIQAAITATQQLAKRQLTWLRSWPDLKTFDPESKTLVKDVSQFIGKALDAN